MPSSAIAEARSLFESGNGAEALKLLNAAREKDSSPRLWLLMAEIFSSLGMEAGSEQTLIEGLRRHPKDVQLSQALANHYYRMDCCAEGLAVIAPLAKQADCPAELLVTHGNLLKALGNSEAARKNYEKVLAQTPGHVAALSNLAGLYVDARDYAQAIQLYRRALDAEPLNSHIAQKLSQTYFRAGNLQEGWQHNNARFGLVPNDPHASAVRRPFTQPLWEGQNLSSSQTLLLWAEQGIGEEILCSSMLEEASARCKNIVVECERRLAPVLKRGFPGMRFFARSDPPAPELTSAAITFQAPLGDLGKLFRADFSAFPKRASYLKADTQKTAELRARYKQLSSLRPLIGISWRSKPLRHGDPKSTELIQWQPLLANAKYFFISLQYGDSGADLAGQPIYNDQAIDQQKSLDDFAAQVAAMDAVITVSNTTAHMAGALGVKGAVLLPASRGLMAHWFDGRDDCPWYPSLALLRQKIDGEWGEVMQRAKNFMANL